MEHHPLISIENINVHVTIPDPAESESKAAQIRAITKRIRSTTLRLKAAVASPVHTQNEGDSNA